jgi:hypothetical protein
MMCCSSHAGSKIRITIIGHFFVCLGTLGGTSAHHLQWIDTISVLLGIDWSFSSTQIEN